MAQECKNYKRPEADLSKYRQAEEDITVMGIDMTYTNKTVKDKEGKYVYIQVAASKDRSSRSTPSIKMATPS
jgi:hypothetical protein